MHRVWILVSVLATALLVAGPAAAQDDEEEFAPPRVISPEECQVEPRPADEVYAVLGLEGDGSAATTPGPQQFPVPPWEPADADTTLLLIETARELLACLNGGDVLRAAALLTDSGAQRLFGVGAADAAAVEARREAIAATPEPLRERARTRLVAITDAALLPDGRAAAFVVVNDPFNPPRGPQTLLFLFTQQDDRWLIDDFIGFTVARPEPAGTPGPSEEPVGTPTP